MTLSKRREDAGGRTPSLLARVLVCAAFIVFFTAPSARAALTFPPLTGRVVDDAHVLPADVKVELSAKLENLERTTSRQLVVVTLPSLQGQDIADYGYQLGRAWGIGQKGLNNGSLFIIAPAEHKVRIEAGYGVEPILTDALSSQILQEKVLPAFRAGDIPAGVVAGTDAIIQQLSLDPSTAEAKAAAAAQDRLRPDRERPVNLFGLIVPLIFVVFVLSRIFGGGRGGGLLPGLVIGSLLGGMRGDGDDYRGGGGDDDNFSGGGGSFGGGGASGGW